MNKLKLIGWLMLIGALACSDYDVSKEHHRLAERDFKAIGIHSHTLSNYRYTTIVFEDGRTYFWNGSADIEIWTGDSVKIYGDPANRRIERFDKRKKEWVTLTGSER